MKEPRANKLKVPRWLVVLLSVAVTGLIFVLIVMCYSIHQARQARFNVDALERYIYAYEVADGKIVERLSDLPDFHIISPYDSLSLRSADLLKGIYGGYIYDFQKGPDQQYSVSASPVGWLTPRIEFGITNEGELKVNRIHVDPAGDSPDEIAGWTAIPRNDRMRTARLPNYL